MTTIEVRTTARRQLVDLTAEINRRLSALGIRDGAVVLQSLHTTAGLTVNENADPDVGHDLLAQLALLAPPRAPHYRHAEGNSDSHVQTTLVGPSLVLIVRDGRLVLGRWQGVFLCEFDGPRMRQVALQPLPAR